MAHCLQVQPLQLRQRKAKCEANLPDRIKPCPKKKKKLSVNPQRKTYSVWQGGRHSINSSAIWVKFHLRQNKSEQRW